VLVAHVGRAILISAGDTVRMRVIAAITDPAVTKRILECMSLTPRAPPIASPSAQGSAKFSVEESVEDFDQTPPDHWDSSV
jgi:hypothetical protein